MWSHCFYAAKPLQRFLPLTGRSWDGGAYTSPRISQASAPNPPQRKRTAIRSKPGNTEKNKLNEKDKLKIIATGRKSTTKTTTKRKT